MRTTLLFFCLLLLSGAAFGLVVGSPGFWDWIDGQPLPRTVQTIVPALVPDGKLTNAQQALMIGTCAYVGGLAFIVYLYEVLRGRRVDSTIEHRRRAARRRYYRRRADRRRKLRAQHQPQGAVALR